MQAFSSAPWRPYCNQSWREILTTRAGMGGAAEKGSHRPPDTRPAPTVRAPCSCTQMLWAGPPCWEDFSGARVLCRSEVHTGIGDTPIGTETHVAGAVLRALPVGLLNPIVPQQEEPTSIFIPILQRG